jgi:hypothetical protein
MNRTITFLAPPLVFGIAAVAAWLTGAPAGVPDSRGSSKMPNLRQRASIRAESGDPATEILEFERKIFVSPTPPVKVHDSAGMDAMLASDDRNRFIPDAGMAAITYALEWAEQSPEEMLGWLIARSSFSVEHKLSPASTLFEQWAKRDMPSALAALPKIPDLLVRAQALASTLEILYPQDADRARELMLQNLSLFPPDQQNPFFNPYDTGGSTCEFLLSLPVGEERTHLLAQLLTRMADWDEKVSGQAQAVWERIPKDLRHELVADGFSHDRDNAVVFQGLEELMRDRAETSGDPGIAEKFIETQGGSWAKRDLAGALDWAQSHLKGRGREEHSAKLFESASGADFDATLGVWQSLPDGFLKDSAAEAMVKGAPELRKAEANAALESMNR